MSETTRHPLSTGAIVAIALASAFGILLLVLGLVVGFLVLYISAYAVRPETHRFASADASPTCTVSGRTIVISYPIGDTDPAFLTPGPAVLEYEVDSARPEELQGFTYVDVTTSPVPPSEDQSDSRPENKNLALRPGTTLVMTLKATSPHATLDGIRLEWSWGETGGKQVLPIHAQLSGGRCVLD